MSEKEKSSPTGNTKSNIFKRLQQLQHHTRANLPAMIAQRAMGAFTLQQEPPPEEATSRVAIVVYPQDPFMGEPEVRTMNAEEIRSGLVNSRVRVQDSAHALAEPDENGNYFYWHDTPQFAQINAFYYTTFTLRMCERYARRTIPWSFPAPRLVIDPHAGNGTNAFYNEQEQTLGFYSFAANGSTVNTAHSADIVSHEAAHAVLDGLRDLFNESFGLGASAFHESFGDIVAVLVALHDDLLVRRLVEMTGGDLRRDNFVAALAEEMTHGLRALPVEHVRTHTIYLRNALNEFRAAPFDTLPRIPADPLLELARDSHSYSRLFTGAFYDILVGIYEKLRQQTPPLFALYRAREFAGRCLLAAIELGPVGELDFGDIARGFLTADAVLYNGSNAEILLEVFDHRRILTRDAAGAHLRSLNELPDLWLPETLNSALGSALFLEEEVLPALKLPANNPLIPLSMYRNAAGYAFLTYFTAERITLDGTEYRNFEGASVNVMGGLTLMFAPDGRVRSVCYRPVTPEDIRQIRVMTADLIQAERIIEGETLENAVPLHRHFSADAAPGALALKDPEALATPDSNLSNVVVRFPVIFDNFAKPLKGDLRTFIQALMQRK